MSDTAVDLDATVYETCTAHPQVPQIMAGLGFEEILEPGRLETMGKFMTIRLGSEHKGVPLEDIVVAFQAAGLSVKGYDDPAPAAQGESSEPASPEERAEALEGFLRRLQAGEPVDAVKADFQRVFSGVAATEVAAAEQRLIAAGEPLEEVQRVCDVHATLFGDNLEEAACAALQDPDADPFQIPGHPLNTFRRENEALGRFEHDRIAPHVAQARAHVAGAAEAAALAADARDFLAALTAHYKRKEDLFFPHLENHGVSGPSQVMWGVDDENRAALKEAASVAESGDAARAADVLEEALGHVDAMTFKEENILMPMLADTLNAREWRDIAVDSEDYATCLIDTPPRWRPSMVALAQAAVEEAKAREGTADAAASMAPAAASAGAPAPVAADAPGAATPAPGAPGPGMGVQMVMDAAGVPQVTIQLPTGSFGVGQLAAVLDTLPFDMTYVDAQDIVRYFSHGETRLFARPQSCLGRNLYLCHPPKSVPVVRRILDDFRSGARDHADFWIHRGPVFAYIRYFAVRDAAGTYQGALEVTQDIAPIQALEGENRRGADRPTAPDVAQ